MKLNLRWMKPDPGLLTQLPAAAGVGQRGPGRWAEDGARQQRGFAPQCGELSALLALTLNPAWNTGPELHGFPLNTQSLISRLTMAVRGARKEWSQVPVSQETWEFVPAVWWAAGPLSHSRLLRGTEAFVSGAASLGQAEGTWKPLHRGQSLSHCVNLWGCRFQERMRNEPPHTEPNPTVTPTNKSNTTGNNQLSACGFNFFL